MKFMIVDSIIVKNTGKILEMKKPEEIKKFPLAL